MRQKVTRKPVSYTHLGGITIVISPLIALIDEQSEKIAEQGIEVLTIHGGMDSAKQANVLKDFANKVINPKFIFVSPEKIATDGLFEYCIRERKNEITMLVIDEVHCVCLLYTSFDDKLVRKLIEKVIVYDDRLVVEFKSGLEIEVNL